MNIYLELKKDYFSFRLLDFFLSFFRRDTISQRGKKQQQKAKPTKQYLFLHVDSKEAYASRHECGIKNALSAPRSVYFFSFLLSRIFYAECG